MASVSGITGSNISITGLASGIDTDAIIEALTTVNSRRIEQLQTRRAQVAQQQTTFNDLRAKLLELQDRTTRLSRSLAGAFDGRTALSSDPDAIAAAASSSAATGTYAVSVLNLAAANQIASEGFSDPGVNIKEGTLALRVGSGPTTTVTVNASNNTLQGLADAINAANGEVRANIINDGTASPYRLLLTANRTGLTNGIQLTNNLTNGSGASIDPSNTLVQAADDARVKIGSGSGAVTVSSSSNRFDKLFVGVTLDVKKADANKLISVTVAADGVSAGAAVADFVSAYNAVVDYIDVRDNYNQATQQAGTLLGSLEANALRQDLARVLSGSVSGINGSVNRLSTIGIKFNDTGKLDLDRAKLDDLLNGKVAGASIEDVKRLFALTGSTNNPGVRFLLGGSKTKPTGTSPYQVDVTQAATQAALTAGSDLGASTIIDGSNNSFGVTVDGRTSSVLSIAHGTYSASALAAAVQAAINADPLLAGSQVIADLSGGKLRLTSLRFGGDSQVQIGAGTAISSGVLGFAGSENANGLNVAGTYIVGGVVETAVGTGQVLSGSSGNANTDGLQVSVSLTPSQVVSGAEADLTVTQGLAERLNGVLNRYLDPVIGRLKSTDKRFEDQIKSIDDTISIQDELLAAKRESLLIRFAAMESAVSRLNALSTQLSLQFVPPSSLSKK